jgi:hypothetical protein
MPLVSYLLHPPLVVVLARPPRPRFFLAVSALSFGTCDGLSQKQRRCQRLSESFQTASPAEIVGQVFGRNPLEANLPGLQSAVIGIDVLNVERSVHNAYTRTEIDALVSEVGSFGKVSGNDVTVGAQDSIRIDKGFEHRAYGLGIGFSRSTSVVLALRLRGNQYWNLLLGQAAFGCYTTAFARGTRQIALAFMRFEKIGLIRFHNAV